MPKPNLGFLYYNHFWSFVHCLTLSLSSRQRSTLMWLFHEEQITWVRIRFALILLGNVFPEARLKGKVTCFWVLMHTWKLVLNQFTLTSSSSYSGHQLDSTAHPRHSERRPKQAPQRLREWSQHSTSATDLRIQQPPSLTSPHLSSQGGEGCGVCAVNNACGHHHI